MEKRIDDSKLGGITGGTSHVEPGGGGGAELGRNPGWVPVAPTPDPGGQQTPEDQGSGSGTSTPFAK